MTTWQGLGRTPDRDAQEALDEATAQAEAAQPPAARRSCTAATAPAAGRAPTRSRCS